MNNFIIPFSIGIVLYVFMLTVIIVQYIRYRITVKEKSRNIFYQAREHTRLASELELTLKKKKALEEILKSFLGDESNKKNGKKLIADF